MLWVRRLLQIAFGLFSCALIFILLKTPNPDYLLSITMLVFFILIILVLGPWWPSSQSAAKWKLDLPTDNPKTAAYLLLVVIGLGALYTSWSVYTDPNHKLYRIEKTIAILFGTNGVAAFWLILGVSCLWGAYNEYNRSKSA